MFKPLYIFLLHLKAPYRTYVLGALYLLFIFSYLLPPLVILSLLFMLLGTVGSFLGNRPNDIMLFALPTSDELVEILKEKSVVIRHLIVLSFTVFLPCAFCFFIGLCTLYGQNLLGFSFFTLSFVWMYWRYFDLFTKLEKASF